MNYKFHWDQRYKKTNTHIRFSDPSKHPNKYFIAGHGIHVVEMEWQRELRYISFILFYFFCDWIDGLVIYLNHPCLFNLFLLKCCSYRGSTFSMESRCCLQNPVKTTSRARGKGLCVLERLEDQNLLKLEKYLVYSAL